MDVGSQARVYEETLLSMHDCDSRIAAEPASRPLRRWKGLAVLSVAAVLLHAAALGGVDWTWPQRDAVPRPAAMQVRVVDDLPVMAVPPAPPLVPFAMPPEPPAPVPVAVVPVRAKAAAVHARVAPTAPAVAPATPAESAAAPPERDLQLALNAPAAPPRPAAAASEAPPVGDETIPHYRTRIPPATTLRYELQRGLLRGTGELTWRPQGERYALTLEGRVGSLPVLTQTSTGAFDAAGVAPERFTDQRLRRGTVAANFQREPGKGGGGKITFSGPSTEYALREGAQDRLSWMVQLAAIVAAEPQLRQPDARVVMYVVGAHGEAGVWVFRCIGPEAVETAAGAVDTIKFVREPREPHDTTVQVWLDPRHHDLPVRALQQSGPNDEPFELRLQAVIAAP